jgi:O-antigen/teichoic acid export membrane protein
LKTSLSTFAFNSIKWSGFSQFGRQVLQIITTIILARLLVPEDFGLVGMAFIVIGFLNIFKDLGTSAAIIQKVNITDTLLSSVFWLNILFGSLIFLTVYFFSPVISYFFNDKRIEPILRVLSASFLISSFCNVHQALLEKKLLFKKLAKIELIATLIGSTIGITLAFCGFKVWSLVFQSIATFLVTSILLVYVEKWKPLFMVNFSELKSLYKYSGFLTGFNVFNYFFRNADNFLIGKFLGPTNLGYYNLAYRIMLYPMQTITVVISRVMFPLYSQIINDFQRLKTIYIKVAQAISLISFPLMIWLMLVSKEFIINVFGKNWEAANLIIIILAPVGMIQSIDATVGSIYQATGRTDLSFKWGLFSGLLSIVVFIVGLNWGIIGVATSYLIYSIILFIPGIYIPFKLINLKVTLFLEKLSMPLITSLSMGILIYLAKIIFNLNGKVELIIVSLIGFVFYFVINFFFNKKNINEIIGLIRNRN